MCPPPKDPVKAALWRERISAAIQGQTKSPETKAKMSAAKKGKPSPNKDRPHTEEWKQNMSAMRKGENNPMWKRKHAT
jgi:hypothetical protein